MKKGRPSYYLTKPIPGTLPERGASFQAAHWTVVLQARKIEKVERGSRGSQLSALAHPVQIPDVECK